MKKFKVKKAKIKIIIFSALTAAAVAANITGAMIMRFYPIEKMSRSLKIASNAMFVCGGFALIVGFLLLVWSIVEYRDKRQNSIHSEKYMKSLFVENPEALNGKTIYDGDFGDVVRVFDVDDSEEWLEKHEEYLKNFLDNVKYPEGFEEFLKEYSSYDSDYGRSFEKWKTAKRIFINEKDTEEKKVGNYDYFEPCFFDSPETIRKTNEYVFTSCDFYAQFREMLVFAGTESGHALFFLDYGKGGEPKVKFLDDELYEVTLVANSFKEFKEKLVTPQKAKEILGDKYYD